MKKNDDPDSKKDLEIQQRLQGLKNEYNSLNEQRIATDRDRKNLEEQLQTLRQKAEQAYGTSDVEELRKLLEERRRENERMVEEYQVHIDTIKSELSKIEEPETTE